jgi:hypothetical protein
LEYTEGPRSDQDANNDGVIDVTVANADTTLGDLDDILAFTARANEGEFVGQVIGQLRLIPGTSNREVVLDKSNPARWDTSLPDHTIVTSQFAEIIWWTSFDDVNGNGIQDVSEPFVTRRQTRLIRPDIVFPAPGVDPVLDYLITNNPTALISAFDLSMSFFPGPRPVANTLSALTNREHRFGHNPARFPYPLDNALMVKKFDWAESIGGIDYTSEGFASDIVLSYVTAFDVKAFDPTVPINTEATNTVALLPGDPGYGAAASIPGVGGGYVDLWYSRQPNLAAYASISTFSGPPHPRSQLLLVPGGPFASYDTWSKSYEYDGVDQDRRGTAFLAPEYWDAVPSTDEGTNGLDDADPPPPVGTGTPINGVDDVRERETSPPYPYPLRGIQVRFRVIDVDSRQVRQVTVASDFIPE